MFMFWNLGVGEKYFLLVKMSAADESFYGFINNCWNIFYIPSFGVLVEFFFCKITLRLHVSFLV